MAECFTYRCDCDECDKWVPMHRPGCRHSDRRSLQGTTQVRYFTCEDCGGAGLPVTSQPAASAQMGASAASLATTRVQDTSVSEDRGRWVCQVDRPASSSLLGRVRDQDRRSRSPHLEDRPSASPAGSYRQRNSGRSTSRGPLEPQRSSYRGPGSNLPPVTSGTTQQHRPGHITSQENPSNIQTGSGVASFTPINTRLPPSSTELDTEQPAGGVERPYFATLARSTDLFRPPTTAGSRLHPQQHDPDTYSGRVVSSLANPDSMTVYRPPAQEPEGAGRVAAIWRPDEIEDLIRWRRAGLQIKDIAEKKLPGRGIRACQNQWKRLRDAGLAPDKPDSTPSAFNKKPGKRGGGGGGGSGPAPYGLNPVGPTG